MLNEHGLIRCLWMILFSYMVVFSLPLARAVQPMPFILVSDVDDTVRVTNVSNKFKMVKNNFLKKEIFSGMPELFKNITNKSTLPESQRLLFLSGAPFEMKISNFKKDFTKPLRNLLSCQNFPEKTCSPFPIYELKVREITKKITVYDFKTKILEKKYKSLQENFILIGDDTESDPKVYENFSTLRKDHIMAIYIHKITEKNFMLPLGQIYFLTAYDIALHERMSGRLKDNEVAEIGDAVYKGSDDTFFPNFQACPTPGQYEKINDLPQELRELKKNIEQRIDKICSSKQKDK